jgi:uncharacterized protein (TIGR00255 family)
MLKSMTAYGRACSIASIGRFVVEIQSVNRKHLEICTYLPKELLRFDADIKKWVAAQVGRGQVNVKISVTFDLESPLVVTPNIALAKQIKAAWDAIAIELQLPAEQGFNLSMLAKESGLLLYDEDVKDEEVYREALFEVVSYALNQCMSMKLREGELLYRDIKGRFDKIYPIIKDIALKAPGATERFRQRLLERLEEVLSGSTENEERLLREVCVYAEKVDIAEELTRFDSHLKQADILLQSDTPAVGKTLEFLVQELNREINTISSKSSDLDISRGAMEIKAELERIREQIQNIE